MQRAKIILELSVDLDIVPGWGNKVEDWILLVEQDLDRQSLARFFLQTHYNPKAKIISTEVEGSDHQTRLIAEHMERGPSGEWRSKVE